MIDDNLDVSSDAPNSEGSALLAADDIPDSNQSLTCFSCDAEMAGLYCMACGQKNDNFRRSIFGLGWETFTSLFAFENRIWRTWWTLLRRPGRVAREYCDGARARWTSPVRIYLFMSIVLFGFLSLTGRQIFSFEVTLTPTDIGIEKPITERMADDYKMGYKTHFFEPRSKILARNETLDFDIIREKVGFNSFDIDLGNASLADDPSSQGSDEEPSIDPDDTPVKIVDGLGREREISTNTFGDYITQIIRDPVSLNTVLATWLPRILFFMLPIAMFSGAIFIRGKNALLYDHLVHAAYIHGVMFLLIFSGIILSGVIPGNRVAQAIMIFMFLYLPRSLRGMFGRGWFKTIMASYLVAFVYFIVILTLLSIILINTIIDNVA